MEPTSRGFAEVRDVFFRELVEVSKNTLNQGGKEKLAEVRTRQETQGTLGEDEDGQDGGGKRDILDWTSWRICLCLSKVFLCFVFALASVCK